MAAVDYERELIDAIWSKLRANAAIVDAFELKNQHDTRDDQDPTGTARRRHGNRSPGDFPSLTVDLETGTPGRGRAAGNAAGAITQGPSTTLSFGVAAGSSSCNAIVPISVPLRIVAKFDSKKLTVQTPLEVAIRAALHVGYPKLGLSYVRMFTLNHTRELSGTEITATFRLVADLRLYTNQLTG